MSGSRRLPCRIVPVVVVYLIDGTYELFRYFLSPAAAFEGNGHAGGQNPPSDHAKDCSQTNRLIMSEAE